jgi:hypothetical protein
MALRIRIQNASLTTSNFDCSSCPAYLNKLGRRITIIMRLRLPRTGPRYTRSSISEPMTRTLAVIFFKSLTCRVPSRFPINVGQLSTAVLLRGSGGTHHLMSSSTPRGRLCQGTGAHLLVIEGQFYSRCNIRQNTIKVIWIWIFPDPVSRYPFSKSAYYRNQSEQADGRRRCTVYYRYATAWINCTAWNSTGRRQLRIKRSTC